MVMPFGKLPPRPEVMISSPRLTSASWAMNSITGCVPALPFTTPTARLLERFTIAGTPLDGSVSGRMIDDVGPTL